MTGSPEPDRPLNETEEGLWGDIERALANDRKLGRRLNRLSDKVGGRPRGLIPFSELEENKRSFIPEVNWGRVGSWVGILAIAASIAGGIAGASAYVEHTKEQEAAKAVVKQQVLGDSGMLRSFLLCGPNLAIKAAWLEEREGNVLATTDEPSSASYRAAEAVAEAQHIPCGDSTVTFTTEVSGMTVTVTQGDFLR